ncbi:cadherin domain-containing protein [Microvirga lotononidis]|uniref:Cadherin domain-containing protein,putative calcium-binding protein n=1 Tax=Microvirga lotononidis TaxID=864069 RepID=I4Z060_9HYPH|nr:cadherin domain-containing protein [Microvirga lotononidis]EIM29602.1 Cadherin domain-containing protein,putative calcium-binding protein [Microvirga lotononidis]WQO27091.1 cadherin domain-containing protein [Microvirga lotononidis]
MPATTTLSSLNVAENPENGTVIGRLGVQGGAPNETFTFTLASSLSDRFEIKRVTENNETYSVLAVKTGGSLFDFETDDLNHFEISISASSTNSTGGTVVANKSFLIDVTNVNEAPTDILLSNATIAETARAGTEVGLLTALDPDLAGLTAAVMPTFTLVESAGGRFQIVDNKLVVAAGATFDYETASSLQVKVKVTDMGGLSFEKTLSISVTDVSEVGGSARNDKIRGTAEADVINGGAGNDWIWGNGGNDTINGGSGKDILFGGDGADTFVFDSPFKKGHFDQIRDFKSGEDKILFDLDALKSFKVKASKSDLFGLSKKGHPDKKSSVGLDKVFKEGKLEKKFFTVGTTSKDGNDYVVYNKKNGTVYLDVDGSGGAKPVEILKLKPGAALSFNDFLFI